MPDPVDLESRNTLQTENKENVNSTQKIKYIVNQNICSHKSRL